MNKHGQYVHKSEQKVTVCIRDGRITYETDSDAIRSASEEVADALADLEKYNLQSQIDDLEDQMEDLSDLYQDQLDFLDEQIEKWEKIAEFAENTANAELATQYLGEDWVVKVITGDDDELWSNMKDLYMQNAEQIAQYDKQITTTENINNLLTEYITAYEEESITYEEALAGIQNLLDQMNSDMTTGQNLQNVLDYMGLMHNTEATVEDVLVGLQTSLDEYAEELIEGIQLNYENGLAIADVRTSWDVMTDNIQDIRDFAEDILDAIEDLNYSNASYYRDDDDDSVSVSASSGGTAVVGSGNYVADYDHSNHSGSYVDSGPGVGYWSTGLEKGIVGESTDTEKAADHIIALGTQNIDETAIPAFLHPGEVVANQEQQEQILKNVQALSSPLATLSSMPMLAPLEKAAPNVDVSIGDIILPDITDPDGFARAMSDQIQSAMRVAISDIHL